MANTIGVSTKFAEQILDNLQGMKDSAKKLSSTNADTKASEGQSFAEHMKEGIDMVNETQKTADKMATDLATGKSSNIHETMLAASHAELSFNFMVQLRNKALEAYTEIMRMPV